MLIHGNYGCGKTHLLGDALRYESQTGPVRYLNIKGEDGQLSITNFGLGDVGETVDSLPDFIAALEEYKHLKLRALAIDGGKHFGRMVIKSVCADRLPSVGRNSDDWSQIHRKFEDTVTSLRWVAPIVIMASSSDRSMDQVSGELSLTPDMPGRQAAGVAGMFDFVFILKALAIGPDKVKRTIETAPVANTIIRQRLPKPLPASIDIPQDGGGWKNLIEAMQKCLDSAPAGPIGAANVLIRGVKK
jgi:hypothetical protein